MSYTFACWTGFVAEQRNEPYERYGEVSSAVEKLDPTAKTLLGNWLCQLARKGGV